MKIRLCWLAIATAFCATPSIAAPYLAMAKARHADAAVGDERETFARPLILVANETRRQEPDIDLFAVMSGKCTTVKVAGRDFKCRAVAYFHGEQGRANFTIVLDDPDDNSHIISFSGENARREDNLYELTVDQMLLNSKDRPKIDGLPVPFVESSAGTCKQVGSFVTARISSISCAAMDRNGQKYELQFESDGSPITVRKIRHRPLTSEKPRARQIEQFECRSKANVAKILPRDLTSYIIQCLAENSPSPASDEPK